MKRLWITYAWKDRDGGDFGYLVGELKGEGVEVVYDKVALVPGRRLWEQIGEKVLANDIDGWAFLITPNSLRSQPCLEEYEYALHKAIGARGNWPIIPLLHGVQFADIPAGLKVRLGFSLTDPLWKDGVKAALENRVPTFVEPAVSPYVTRINKGLETNKRLCTVEFYPRFGVKSFYRFGVPKSAKVVQWGHGPGGATGDAISPTQTMVVEGFTGSANGIDIVGFGAGDYIGNGISAYLVLDQPYPEFFGVGFSKDAMGMEPLEFYRL